MTFFFQLGCFVSQEITNELNFLAPSYLLSCTVLPWNHTAQTITTENNFLYIIIIIIIIFLFRSSYNKDAPED